MDYVFAGLNMNILFKKSPENAPFMDDASKARGNNKCWDLAVVCPPHIKIPGYVPGYKQWQILQRSATLHRIVL